MTGADLLISIALLSSPSPSAFTPHAVDVTLIVGIAGLVVAVAAIAAGIWAARRWGSRRTVLRIDYRFRPLGDIHLKTSAGVEVIRPNPPVQFVVEFRISNRGPADILPAHFNGEPLRFSFSPATLIPRQMSNVGSGALTMRRTSGDLEPLRIAVNRQLFFQVRTANRRPQLWVDSPVENVRLRLKRHRDTPAGLFGDFTLDGSNRWLRSRVTER